MFSIFLCLYHLYRNIQEYLGGFFLLLSIAKIFIGKILANDGSEMKREFSIVARVTEEKIFDEKYNDLIHTLLQK